MLFKSASAIAAVVFVLASSVSAAAVDTRAALIATDPVAACNCPNNCDYGPGHSCKYKAGPSTSSSTVDGTCTDQSGTLTCLPN